MIVYEHLKKLPGADMYGGIQVQNIIFQTHNTWVSMLKLEGVTGE